MAEWQRRAGGYLRADGKWFLCRGAPMAGGRTNAWLLHERVTEDRVARGGHIAYDEANGDPLWRIAEDGYVDTAAPDYTGALYAHEFDAGSLAEAKDTAAALDQRDADRRLVRALACLRSGVQEVRAEVDWLPADRNERDAYHRLLDGVERLVAEFDDAYNLSSGSGGAER
jgi:hypothetical protein